MPWPYKSCADKAASMNLVQLGFCPIAGLYGKCSMPPCFAKDYIKTKESLFGQGGSTQQGKGPGGWPSQNPGEKSGKGRDNNPPKYK